MSTPTDPTTPARGPVPTAVVVVNYGSHRLLAANLPQLRSSARAPLAGVRIVVVDNRTDAGERERVRELCRQHSWELVEQAGNDGFAAGVNAGARRAAELGCRVLLMLNPDAILTADVLDALREQVTSTPDTAVSPRIVTPRGDVEFRGSQVSLRTGRIRGLLPGTGDDGRPTALDGQRPGRLRGPVQGWLTGACLALTLDLFDRIGGLDPRYFLYWEDVDLSHRLERAGARLVVRQDLSVVHEQGSTHGSAGSRARSDTYYYYNCRNRLVFAARNLSRGTVLRWLLATPRQSWLILMRGGKRQLLHSRAPLWAAVRGSLAGALIALRAVLDPQSGRRAPGARRAPGGQRVLVVHPGAELYGSDRMLLEAVSGLVGAGAHVTVALPDRGPLVENLSSRGARVEFCRFPVLRKSALGPRGMLLLARDLAAGLPRAVRLVRTAGADGVYVNTVTIPSWLLLARLLRRPAACHVHEAERSARRVLRRALTLPLRAADRIVVNSEYSLGVLLETAPSVRDRCTVVGNGVFGPEDPPPAREQLTGALRLLYVGRLSPRKGPAVALAAARRLTRDGADVHLTLLGSTFPGYEWFERELRADAAEADLAGRVEFLGFRPDVWPHLAAADVVLVPSVVDEPFGNTAVEAILAARPAVLSDTSGLREAGAGYRAVTLVPPGDPAALAAAITDIAAGWPEAARLAENDAVQARERHSPARYRREIAAAVDAARTHRAGSR